MRATQVCPEPGLLRLRGGAFVRQAGEPDFHLLPGERQVELPCGGAEPVDDVKALVGRLLAAEQQACGLVQKLSEPSSKLGDGAASGGEGGVSLWGTVPACGIHRDQPGDGQPGGGAILGRDKTGPSHGPCEHNALRIRLDREFDWTLQLEADGCRFRTGRKLKMEMPDNRQMWNLPDPAPL